MQLIVLLLLQHGEKAFAVERLINMVKSDSIEERRNAYRYSLTDILGVKRLNIKKQLVQITRTEHTNDDDNYWRIRNSSATYSPRRIALSIMAEWSDPELVSLFIEYINFESRDPNCFDLETGRRIHSQFAAVKGLINIGMPAIQPCINEIIQYDSLTSINKEKNVDIKRKKHCRVSNLVYVLWYIVGYQEAKNALTTRLTEIDISDNITRERLQSAITHLDQNYSKKNTR